MLHHRHEFDVGEAHLGNVVGQLHRQLAIAERAIALLRHAHPRAEMHLVGRHGRVEFVVLVARTHPLVVAPFVLGVPDDRRGARRNLVVEGERVSLVDPVHVIARTDVVLVHRAAAEIGDEGFPDARVLMRLHGMQLGIPVVEVADHGDALGIGSPHGELRTALAVALGSVRAEFLEEPRVLALVEQMQIVRGQQGCGLFLGRQRCHSFGLLKAWMTVCHVVMGGAGNSVREKAWPAREASEDELPIAVCRYRA